MSVINHGARNAEVLTLNSKKWSIAMDAVTRERMKEKGYTDKQLDDYEKFSDKAVKVVAGSLATVVAVAGASIVSLFKRDAAPIKKTFGWCKDTFCD